MKVNKKRVFWLLLFTLLAVFLTYLHIDVEIERGYFDINNGRLMTEKVILGIKYNQKIKETSYSKLLQLHSFSEQNPKWVVCYSKRTHGNWGGHNPKHALIHLADIASSILQSLFHDSPEMTNYVTKLKSLVEAEDFEGVNQLCYMLMDKYENDRGSH